MTTYRHILPLLLLVFALPAFGDVDREQVEQLRDEAIRSRGFIRAAETQLTKVIDLADALLAAHEPGDDDTQPDLPVTDDPQAYIPDEGETLAEALRAIKDTDKRTIVLAEGRWQLGDDEWLKQNGPGEDAKVTIRAMPGVDRDAVILHRDEWGTWRPHTQITYEGLSVDWANISQFYYGVKGFRDCVWFDSRPYDEDPPGKRLNPIRGGYWFEDSVARDMLYGAVGADRVEGSHFERIWGDVWQGSLIVRNCTVDDIDGSILPHHTDLFQTFGPADEILWENIEATNIRNTQAFMLQTFVPKHMPEQWDDWDERATIGKLTIRNVRIETPASERDDPPYSQIGGFFRDIEIDGLDMPGQRLLFRKHHGRGGFDAVTIKNSTLHPGSELPEGVEVRE